MPASPSFALSRYYGRGPTIQPIPFGGEPGGRPPARLARPLCALNNQHSHVEEELAGMQSQLLVALQTPNIESHRKPSQPKHHVFHDTELRPYQRQQHRHIHHDQQGHGQGHSLVDEPYAAELADAVELSYQYSNNIVSYRTDTTPDHYQQPQQYPQGYFQGMPATPLRRPSVQRARVVDYSHPSVLAKQIVSALLIGGKLLLELPDEPAAVASLLTALGRAAAKLRSVGFATALDPVYESATTACHSGASANGHGSSSSGGGGSPMSSHDWVASGGQRRAADSCPFVLCARAVPIPPVVTASASAAAGTYSVGTSMGQQVLRVGPSIGVHTLLPALLGAVLRDGLVTLRCCWFDEEAESDPWSDNEDTADHDGECDATSLPTRSGSPGGGCHAGAMDPNHPAGSLVRVPCVLRAIFKLDRQLRGLDLGGLVLLPHTFTKPGRCINTQVLYLDVVIA